MAAPAWKRMLKWSAWLLGGALAIPVVCYIVLLLINWRDQPPSAAALRLAADYRNRPAIPDADNAYIYVMGFEVAPDADPRAAGARRIEWIQRFPPEIELPPVGDPVTPYENYGSSRSLVDKEIVDACATGSGKCVAALERGDDEIRAWITSEQWLLDRYLTLLQHPGWLETAPSDVRALWPSYQMPLDGQKLLIAKAYVLAGDNNAASVRELLGHDVRFWRRVLTSSDTLITKMIATAALNRTFAIGNLAMRRLPPEIQLTALPAEWTTPLTDDERSLLRCLTGEWIATSKMLDQIVAANSLGKISGQSDGNFLEDFQLKASMPLFKLQDTKNRQADMLIRASTALNVPIEHFSAGLDQARQVFNNPVSGNPFASLYNPLGRMLVSISAGAHASYPSRVADVEGARRAAMLTAELRARKVAQQNLSKELAASQIRTPYTGEPFTWNAEEQAIVFVGMEPSERGRHAFKY